MLMKKSEVKTCTGNGLLDILGLVILVIVYGGGYTVTYLIIKTSSYQTHVIVIEVMKYTCDNLMVSFCKVFGYRWQFVTETTSIF